MEITIDIVSRLIQEQCPQYKDEKIKPVEKSGHDNRTFHLGDKMIVRLPSGKDYASQALKENKWLPYLSKRLTTSISNPIFLGSATDYYPFVWSILDYIEGETVNYDSVNDLTVLAFELSKFLKEFQAIDTKDGPLAGMHNFYRGGDLTVYHQETLSAITKLKDEIPIKKIDELWQMAIASKYDSLPVWVHGDLAPGNILVQNRHLSAIIDFGILGVGDPACDYAMAWTFFDSASRKIFLKDIPMDMQHRAMGWALWKALITYHDENQERASNASYTIQEILKDY